MESSDSTQVIFKDDPQRKFNLKLGCALVAAVVCCLLLLVVCIVLAVLYSQELGKPLPAKSSKEKVEKYEICDEDKCFRLGQELVKNMNKSVDPCENFYAYACGGWQRRHPLKNNETVTSTAINVQDKIYLDLLKSLKLAPVVYSKNDAVMKLVRVYKSCLNTTAIDALGLQPMKELIKQYGGWSISKNYDSNVTIAQRIGRAARDLNVDSLFGMDVQTYRFNSSINVLLLIESKLGLKKRDYLDLTEESEKKRKDYKNSMKAMSRLFNAPYAKMEAIYDFEVKLAKIMSGISPEAALNDYIKTIAIKTRSRRNAAYESISLLYLSHKTGFPWPVLSEVLSNLFHRHLTGYEKIYPIHMDFFKEISVLYKNTNHIVIADYIMWHVVRYYFGALYGHHRSRVARVCHCIGLFSKPFDMPLGLLYVNDHFNDTTKSKIKEMIENVRTSFIQKLPTETWMDKKTQEKAKEKALAIKIEEIGYPSYIKDPAKLKAQYDSLKVSDSLMDNLKAANHFVRMRTLRKFERPVDKNEWIFGSPIEWNGLNYRPLNGIVFLAGILQKPMYSPDYPRYIDYGAIGVVIGHEITHGFDASGRTYDKNGNVQDWWSDGSSANFESKSKCFVKQYDKYKIFDKYANGTKTLDENISDNGGIKLAYDAYQRLKKENGTEKILPGLDLNPNQLFFLGFAQSWCSLYSKEGAYHQLDTDDHSTAKYRIIGSLSNFKKFSEVFKCKPNSGMNPVNKCELW